MIYRLTYCNKAGTEAVVDIQKGTATPVYAVEGTDNPFTLLYNNDRGDKSGSVRSSGADINIYETAEFNIDELKTSSETEISVKYYINDVLQWSGFVIPDFFSKQITGGAGVVSMVASDRLNTLKGVTLSGLSAKISNRALAEMCLANTGLALPLYTMADFTGDGVNIFNSEVLSQRMIDTKGRSISCYDILSSLLEQTNSLLIQRAGAWHIINKVQLEAGSGSLYSNATTSTAWNENTVNFRDVNVGSRRTIIPVASMVGVYHEHGGGRLHPDNYDFSQGLTGWTAINGFNAVVENRSIEGYTPASNPIRMVPNYGEVTTKNTIRSINQTPGFDPDYDIVPYLKSSDIPIVSVNDDVVDINVDVSAIGPHNAAFRYVVLATKGATRLYLNASGTFEPFVATDERHISFLSFGQQGINIASVKSKSITGKLNNPAGYSISIRVYGSGEGNPIFINFASVSFSNADNIPNGTMYKREQGANYTKTHEIPTVLWGDYLTNGLDGYFYEYPIDDTSSLYLPDGSLHSTWTAYGDTNQLPLLQHISRQKARMFSVAHDLLTADIDAVNFDPLSIFVDCNDNPKRYVVVSSKFDFLRSRVSVDLEEVVYINNTVRDFIYSYFGDGESGIKSIGGISGGSGGGGGTGGGLTSEQIEILSFWKKDPENPDTIFTEMNAYSKLELSAYGAGTGGGGGGSDYERLDTWASYDSSKAEWVLSAFLGNDLNTRVTAIDARVTAIDARVTDLENSAGGGGSGGIIETVYGYGNLGQTFNNADLTDTFNAYTINQINTRLVAVENGSATTVNTTGTGNAITSISKAGSVITANKDLSFLETSIFNTHNTDNVRHITGAERTKWDGVVTDFGNLEIGGRNLIVRHNEIKNTWIDAKGDISGNSTTSTMSAYIPVIPGDIFTFSKKTDNSPDGGAFRWRWFDENENYIARAATLSNNYIWEVPPSTFFIQVSYPNSEVAKPKLEKGTIPTDWSPAFEDQVSDWLTTDVNSFSFIKNKPTTLSGYGITDATQRARVGGTANSIFSRDTRSVNEIPNTDRAGGMWLDFKSSSAIGLTGLGQGTFSGVLTILPYIDSSGNSTSGGRIALSNGNLFTQKANATDYTNWNKLAFITDNVASATKLQTARTIWGQSFDGTGNVTGALSGATTIATSISVATPKVIFNAAGWSMEQVGSELQMKHNNVLKMRFTSAGSIIATEEITAFG